MNPVFADTAYYIAAVIPRDEFHEAAVRASHALRRSVVTTEFVLIEVGNWLSRSSSRGRYVRLFEAIEADADTTVIPADHALFVQGVELYRQRPDKDWSLTDCISFVVMTHHDLREALTADRHFEQAGFRALLSHS